MQEIVFRSNDNQALTTSMIVAEKFGKEHSDVLKAIKSLFTTGEKSLFVGNQQLAKMFSLTEVEQPMPVGGGVKKLPIYVMNRDGFTLLAMGFTGAKALAFKLEYMNAFNAMEQQIRQSSGVPQTFSQALMLAAKQQEQIEAQQKQLEMQKPKSSLKQWLKARPPSTSRLLRIPSTSKTSAETSCLKFCATRKYSCGTISHIRSMLTVDISAR
jgi:anti-repressor protein